ncbi:MAG TPA: ribosome maturation factor RimM [Pyrinomonadaceae bacterium]|nr:ribosome maturation factor RimM [Pyrinomonadaceae bacterium]
MSDRERPAAVPEADPPAGELVAVARAVKTRGLRGEIVAELLTDFPERFEGLEKLIAVAPTGERKWLDLEEHWFHGERIVLKFAGYDSIEEAAALVGYEFAVTEAERVPLAEDEFYDWELKGCRVETVEGEALGVVRGVMRTGGVEMLVVENPDGAREHLIPLAEEICVEIDVENRLVRVDPPEGLLEF